MTEIVIVGEAWGENEAKIQSAFVGASGIELLRMLDEGGVIELSSEDNSYIYKFWQDRDPRLIDMVWRMHPEIYRTNVFNVRPDGNKIENLCGTRQEGISGLPALFKSKYVRAEYEENIDRLAEELLEQNPNVVIAAGNTPSWALLGDPKISQIRGRTHLSAHCVSGFKVLPVYHPAAIMRMWDLRPTTVIDLNKAHRERGFPEIRRMKREIWIEPSLEDIRTFFDTHIQAPGPVSVDIETVGRLITCIGFAPNPRIALVVPFVKSRGTHRNYWLNPQSEREVWEIVSNFLSDGTIKKTFQNGMYDIAFLWRAYGLKTRGAEEDTMLLHHALYPESEKSLGYLGSVYTDEGAWKRMRSKGTIKSED